MKPKKPTKLQHGILLAVFWLARHLDLPRVAANLAKDHGVDNLDLSDFDDFEKEIYGYLNDYEATNFLLSNTPIERDSVTHNKD